MIIIPIGTKSTLALKPIVTISLIATCIVVHFLSNMSSGNVTGKLITVYPELYADQVHLYLLENQTDEYGLTDLNEYQLSAISQIRNAKEFYTIEEGIYQALDGSCSCFDKIEKFGDLLLSRSESHYSDSPVQSELFRNWKIYKGKEDKVLARLPSFSLGLVPRKMNRFWTFITHLFLHGDIWHLLGNMLFLWVVGCLLEDSWGRVPFLIFYLAGGVFAGWAHCLQDTSSTVPLIGASGAIAAIMGAFTIRHFMTKIKFFYLFVFFIRPYWGNFFLPAFVFLPFWFFQQVALKSLYDNVGGSGVAYLAHIAGYMAGIITALSIKATGIEKKWIDPMVEKKQISEGVLRDPRFNKACELLGQNKAEEAVPIFSKLVEEKPHDLNLAQDITVLYMDHGIFGDCQTLGESTLKNLIIKSRMAEAAQFAHQLIGCRELVISGQPLLRIAKWITGENRYGEAHDVYRYVIKNNESPNTTARASILLARLIHNELNDPDYALELIKDAKMQKMDSSLMETLDETARMIEMARETPCHT
ncbi:MAG: rhomboid family intramembrane serine protease [Candidatus Krumholzibacteriota bacterium]|nr:rhomboid family intramembrane serine protease [Candidatus Krumholzibacteriota bacterium]